MADIDNALRLWSSTASNNKPIGSTSIGSGLDDNLRQIQSVVRQYLASPGTTIASAATVDLSLADGRQIPISGTNTVTGLGTEVSGVEYLLTTTGAVPFKNSSALSLPNAADFVAANGDYLLAVSKGSGNWVIPWRTRDYIAEFALSSGSSLVGFIQSGSAVVRTEQAKLREIEVSVKDYGAVGDDSTDDITAFNSADTALAALGGGKLRIPAGTYKLSSRYQPSNNITVSGDGIGVTNIHNSSGSSPTNIPIDIRGVLGSNYAINAPTEGGLTVTTTTAGNAGNFSVGESIGVSGPLVLADYGPFWITKVVSAVAGTGVITLTEPLPRADYTLVHKLTTLKQNIIVENLSLSQGGDLGTVAKYSRDITYRNVGFGPSLATAGINVVSARNVTVRDSRVSFNLGSNSSFETHFISNVVSTPIGSAIIFENACEGGIAFDNTVINPEHHGVQIDTSSQRVRVLFNKLINIPNLWSGIYINGNALGFGENVIVGNRLFGNGVGDYGISMGGTTHDNIVIGNTFKAFDYGIFVGAGNNLRQVIWGNSFKSMVIANMNIDAGSSVIDAQIMNALVALGGGAAPTLGTIGGTGPATAAQNSWMKVLDATGTAFWVPVWK